MGNIYRLNRIYKQTQYSVNKIKEDFIKRFKENEKDLEIVNASKDLKNMPKFSIWELIIVSFQKNEKNDEPEDRTKQTDERREFLSHFDTKILVYGFLN